jgi:hypothetical protein
VRATDELACKPTFDTKGRAGPAGGPFCVHETTKGSARNAVGDGSESDSVQSEADCLLSFSFLVIPGSYALPPSLQKLTGSHGLSNFLAMVGS